MNVALTPAAVRKSIFRLREARAKPNPPSSERLPKESGVKENKLLYQTRVCVKTSRAWSIKEAFSCFWNYIYKGATLSYFNRWYYWATHSQLDPIIKVAKMLKRHLDELLNYFEYRITNANAESVN